MQRTRTLKARTTLLDVIRVLPLHVASYLDLVEVVSLSQTCYRLSRLAKFVAHYRLSTLCSPYFDNVDKFFAFLQRSSMIIGGSAVLSIVRPGNWTPGDLDLVLNLTDYIALEEFLYFEDYSRNYTASQATDALPLYGAREGIEYQWVRYTRNRNGRVQTLDLSVTKDLKPEDFVLTYVSDTLLATERRQRADSRGRSRAYSIVRPQ